MFQEKDENRASYYEKRGYCYQKKGEINKAIKDFQSAVNMEPRTKHFWLVLCRALMESENFDDAKDGRYSFRTMYQFFEAYFRIYRHLMTLLTFSY